MPIYTLYTGAYFSVRFSFLKKKEKKRKKKRAREKKRKEMDLETQFACTKSWCDCKLAPEDRDGHRSEIFIKVVDNTTGKRHKFCSAKVHESRGGIDAIEENCGICRWSMYGTAFDSDNSDDPVCVLCCKSLIDTLVAKIEEAPCRRYIYFDFKPKYINDHMMPCTCPCGISHPVQEEGEPVSFISKKGDKVPLRCSTRVMSKLSKMHGAKKRRYVELRAVIDDWMRKEKKRFWAEREKEKEKEREKKRSGAKRVLRTYLAPCVTDSEIDDICQVKRTFGMKAEQLDALAEAVNFPRFMKWFRKLDPED